MSDNTVPAKTIFQSAGKIEELLYRWRSGELKCFAFAYVDNNNIVTSGWEPGANHLQLVGAIATLQHDVIMEPNSADYGEPTG